MTELQRGRKRSAGPGAPVPPRRKRARARVGLRDVAEVAGVSTATVSRAMNNPELVSPELRMRIESVVNHLGWVPHAAARALTTHRTGVIGAIFPALTQGDFARCSDVLQHELAQRGYTLLLACSEYDLDQEYQQVRKFLERGVDALVLVGENHHPDLAGFLAKREVPVINTFVYSKRTHGTCIGPDNHGALHRLTNMLIELGHRRFGVIAQSTANNDRARARLDGVRDALAEKGLAILPAHLVEGRWGIHEGRELFRRIVATKPWPTAVVCGNAYLAVGALLESQAMGIAVPATMSIAGYDDIEIMRELPVPITTVRVSSDVIGRRAAQVLVARLEHRAIETAYEVEAEIIVRESSGPPTARA